MTYEVVVAAQIGILTTADARKVPAEKKSFPVVVLRPDAPPFVGVVEFGDIPGGHAAHRGLKCPRCARPNYKLFYNGLELGCARCTRQRSRRQIERSCRSWNKYGGALEDLLLRALRPGRSTSSVPPAIGEAARRLTAEDEERCSALLDRAANAMTTATTSTVDITDVIEEPRA